MKAYQHLAFFYGMLHFFQAQPIALVDINAVFQRGKKIPFFQSAPLKVFFDIFGKRAEYVFFGIGSDKRPFGE